MAGRDTVCSFTSGVADVRDMYTFNADRITSYELGSEEPTTLANKSLNLFTASADDILSRMAKVRVLDGFC